MGSFRSAWLSIAGVVTVGVLGAGCSSSEQADPSATNSNRTAVTASTTTSPSTSTTVVCPSAANGVDSEALGLELVTSTAVWTMVPDGECARGSALPTGFTLSEWDVVTGESLTTRRVATADMVAAAPDFHAVPATPVTPPSPWGNLSGVGVVGHAAVFYTEKFLLSVDADTGQVQGIDLAPYDRSGGTVPAYFGVVDGTLLAIQGGDVARVNLDEGTVDALGNTGLPGGSPPSDMAAAVKFEPDAAWMWTGPMAAGTPSTDDPSTVVRIDGDGSIHTLDQFDRTILPGAGGPYAGPGLLWALTVDPGVDFGTALYGSETLYLTGVDRDDGHVVAQIVVPPEPTTTFLAFAFRDGFLAVTSSGVSTSWRWVDNAGTSTTVATPSDFTPFAAVGDRLVGRTSENTITSIAAAELVRAPR